MSEVVVVGERDFSESQAGLMYWCKKPAGDVELMVAHDFLVSQVTKYNLISEGEI